MSSFNRKCDEVIEGVNDMFDSLEHLEGDDFCVALSAFRFISFMTMAHGWDFDELVDHLKDEWENFQEFEAHQKRMALN